MFPKNLANFDKILPIFNWVISKKKTYIYRPKFRKKKKMFRRLSNRVLWDARFAPHCYSNRDVILCFKSFQFKFIKEIQSKINFYSTNQRVIRFIFGVIFNVNFLLQKKNGYKNKIISEFSQYFWLLKLSQF